MTEGCLLLLAAGLFAADQLRPTRILGWLSKRAPVRSTAEPEIGETLLLRMFAECLGSGLPVDVSARYAAAHATGGLATYLARSADLAALGVGIEQACKVAPTAGASTEQLRAVVTRALRTGSAVAGAVNQLAVSLADAKHSERKARAGRLGVLIAAPLAVCFLPSFVLLGIAPTVVGLVHGFELPLG